MDECTAHIRYLVWVDIEEFNDETGVGTDCDAPGAALAGFPSYGEAWAYALRVTELAEGINL